MRTRIMTLVLSAGIFLVSLPMVARATPRWTGPAQPTAVWAGYSNGAVYLPSLSNPNNCSNGTLIQFSAATSDPSKIQTIATAALLSGKKLNCVVDGCTSDGFQLGQQCVLTN